MKTYVVYIGNQTIKDMLNNLTLAEIIDVRRLIRRPVGDNKIKSYIPIYKMDITRTTDRHTVEAVKHNPIKDDDDIEESSMISFAMSHTYIKEDEEGKEVITEDDAPRLVIYTEKEICREALLRTVDKESLYTIKESIAAMKDNETNTFEDLSLYYIDDRDAAIYILDLLIAIKSVRIQKIVNVTSSNTIIDGQDCKLPEPMKLKIAVNAKEYFSAEATGSNLAGKNVNYPVPLDIVDKPYTSYKFSTIGQAGLSGYHDLTCSVYSPIVTIAMPGNNYTAGMFLSSKLRCKTFTDNVLKMVQSMEGTSLMLDTKKKIEAVINTLPDIDTRYVVKSKRVDVENGFVIIPGWNGDLANNAYSPMVEIDSPPDFNGEHMFATDAYRYICDYIDKETDINRKISEMLSDPLFAFGLETLLFNDKKDGSFEPIEDPIYTLAQKSGYVFPPYIAAGNILGIVGVPIHYWMVHPSLSAVQMINVLSSEEKSIEKKRKCYYTGWFPVIQNMTICFLANNALRYDLLGEVDYKKLYEIYNARGNADMRLSDILNNMDMNHSTKFAIFKVENQKQAQFSIETYETIAKGYDIVTGSKVNVEYKPVFKKGATSFDDISKGVLKIEVKTADASGWHLKNCVKKRTMYYNLVPVDDTNIDLLRPYDINHTYAADPVEETKDKATLGVFEFLKIYRVMLTRRDSKLDKIIDYIPHMISDLVMRRVIKYIRSSVHIIGKYTLDDIVNLLNSINIGLEIVELVTLFKNLDIMSVIRYIAGNGFADNTVIKHLLDLADMTGTELAIKSYIYAMCSDCSGEPLNDLEPSAMTNLIYMILTKMSKADEGDQDTIANVGIKVMNMAIAYRLTMEIKKSILI